MDFGVKEYLIMGLVAVLVVGSTVAYDFTRPNFEPDIPVFDENITDENMTDGEFYKTSDGYVCKHGGNYYVYNDNRALIYIIDSFNDLYDDFCPDDDYSDDEYIDDYIDGEEYSDDEEYDSNFDDYYEKYDEPVYDDYSNDWDNYE